MAAKTILLVDDSLTDLRLMTTALQTQGYHVVTAMDGEEALQQARQQQPHLVLLDIVLPKRNGFQVCRQLKNSPETRSIKVILVSSKTQDSDRFWGLKQGADDYLTKPFDAKALLASVQRYL